MLLLGCGIGTGPGVIQDHYSPTMGRHRTNPHYNGHTVNGNGAHQPQYEAGSKPYIKPNQVHAEEWCDLTVLNFCELMFITESVKSL